MNRIQLLSEQVANQIAAGEVVDRPASVVKELVENAIDAEASRILVEIQAGGRSLMRVTDDGTGMGRDDALLCLERHATSKIRRAEDLASIATMGFRGEALPSIASVSRLTLTTLAQGTEGPATQVVVNGGKMAEVKEAGAPPGTCLEVRQLFFNLPARRKFLRTEETEYGHIHHYLTLAALSFPHIAFTLVRDGRRVWQLPALGKCGSGADALGALRERMRALTGSDEALVPVDFAAEVEASGGRAMDGGADFPDDLERAGQEERHEADQVRVWGWIGAPGLSRATRQDQHLFVNRRPVENRGINMALLEGYHTALMKGRYPVCCLFLELDPARVDVNIHPAKREVKFRDERGVRRLVGQAVRQALLEFHGAANPADGTDRQAADSPPQPRSLLDGQAFPLRSGQATRTAAAPAAPREDRLAGAGDSVEPDHSNAVAAKLVAPSQPDPSGDENAEAGPIEKPMLISDPPDMAGTSSGTKEASWRVDRSGGGRSTGEPRPLLDVPLRLVGVVGRLYAVLESDRGMVLMDQHAAHERVLFEDMLARMQQGSAPSQRLLLPETVELSVRDARFLRDHLGSLTRLGVGLSEFGERTFMLDALPPFVRASEPRRFVLELIDSLQAAGADVNSHRLGEDVVAKTVCRHAVKANDALASEELEHLVRQLRECQMPYTCPHGRPTLIEMSYRELERKFGRSGLPQSA